MDLGGVGECPRRPNPSIYLLAIVDRQSEKGKKRLLRSPDTQKPSQHTKQ